MISFEFLLITSLGKELYFHNFMKTNTCEILFHFAILRKKKKKNLYIPATNLKKHQKNFRCFRKAIQGLTPTFTTFKANFQKKGSIKNTKDINQSNFSIS